MTAKELRDKLNQIIEKGGFDVPVVVMAGTEYMKPIGSYPDPSGDDLIGVKSCQFISFELWDYDDKGRRSVKMKRVVALTCVDADQLSNQVAETNKK